MKFGTEVLIERGGFRAPKDGRGCRRFVKGILIGAYGYERIIRLTEDDPCDTVG